MNGLNSEQLSSKVSMAMQPRNLAEKMHHLE